MPLPQYDAEAITRQLYEAAQSHRVCSIQSFKESASRIIHPYGICRTPQNKVVIVCWQEYGYSFNNKGPGYRNLMLMECVSVKTLQRPFFTRNDFDPNDPQYTEWVFHI